MAPHASTPTGTHSPMPEPSLSPHEDHERDADETATDRDLSHMSETMSNRISCHIHQQCLSAEAELSKSCHRSSDGPPHNLYNAIDVNDSHSDVPANTSSTPKFSYEEAYSHGYTHGFTKAHIELRHQPIAIIGMACRFPGDVSTPEEFWDLCARARTGFTEIPPRRFESKRWFHPNPGKAGTINARGGNFIEHDITAFDAPFFQFTAQEAISLDPQIRLLLECTFEALESAGLPKHQLVGEDVGVFVGGSMSEYECELFRDSETAPMHQASGCAPSMQANRLSHFFDFRGPSFTVDTACSASLVALHSACMSLRSGESKAAVVAGVHLNTLPDFWNTMSMSRLFSEDGKSRAFDQRGSGFGRGEGVGLIIVKPLEQAIKDNDPIRAVIMGTGVNQDGKTPGITMPSGLAQEKLIRSVYENAGISPRDTGYVEAHGTGTRVGDPIELTALHNVFHEGRTKRKPLFIGSAKSNIGHLEAAAGIAGLIKTVLMLERGFIVPNAEFEQPNEKIPFDQWGIKVPTVQRPWPMGKRWASVNSFGFGGANAHVVLSKAPLDRKTITEDADFETSQRLYVLSANDKVSAERVMQKLGIYLEQRPEIFEADLISNLAYTLGQRKSLMQWRIAIPASTSRELVEMLSSGNVVPAKEELDGLRVGFIFTGQGAQWWAMGRELYGQYPVYAKALDRADAHLTSIGAPFSLLEELLKDERNSQVNAASLSQPSCTAIQLALTDLLRSWNVIPSAVAGHSSGEIGAAYAASFITFEDAMTIAYHRGRLVPILKERHPELAGCMLAVGAGEDVMEPLISQIPETAGLAKIACINSPSSVTISGDVQAITELELIIDKTQPGLFARKLQVDTAYHSHHMDLVAKDYAQALAGLHTPMDSGVHFHSSLLGRRVDSSELDASYWVQNLTCAVRFAEAVQSLAMPVDGYKTGANLLVEVGPHSALQGPVKQILKAAGGHAAKITYASALSRKKNAVETALSLAGTLFVKGALLNLEAINFPKPLPKPPVVLSDMPRYPWNHQKFHHESRFTKVQRYDKYPRSDIIGVKANYSNDLEPTFRNIVRLDELPWLRHHQVQGITIFPISGFAAMAIEAGHQLASRRAIVYETLEIHSLKVTAPLMIPDEDLEMTITLRPKPGEESFAHGRTRDSFRICSWTKDKGWTEHCIGSVSTCKAESQNFDMKRSQQARGQKFVSKITAIQKTAVTSIPFEGLYGKLSNMGVEYGKNFQGLQDCHASGGFSRARIQIPDTATDMPNHYETEYILHPTLLELLIELYWPIFESQKMLDTVYLPSSIGKITVSADLANHVKTPGSSLNAFCETVFPSTPHKANTLCMFATARENAAEALISIQDLVVTPILEKAPESTLGCHRELCYKVVWEPAPKTTQCWYMTALPRFNTEIAIIHHDPCGQQGLITTLAGKLAKITGRDPIAGRMSEIDAKGKLCIVVSEIDRPVLSSLDIIGFSSLKTLMTSAQSVLWVVRGAYGNSQNPDTNMVAGFSRTLRSEGTLMDFVTLDLDAEQQLSEVDTAQMIVRVLAAALGEDRKGSETEFMERTGSLLTPRIVIDDELNAYVHQQLDPSALVPTQFTRTERPLRGFVATPGALDTVHFQDDTTPQVPLPGDQVEIAVKAVHISHRDVQVAMGNCNSPSNIGVECSGIVTATGSAVSDIAVGDRVAAITTESSISTVARAQKRFLVKLPDHYSFSQAATLPITHCTAWHGLAGLAALSEGDSILIHDAAKAAGQAAASIARIIGAEIFATVRSAEESDMLTQILGLDRARVFNIRSDFFTEAILDATLGKGVDVVFNTESSKELLLATWPCMSAVGYFIDVQQGESTRKLCADLINKNVTIASVDMAALISERPHRVERALTSVGRLLRQGRLEPTHLISSFGISHLSVALQSVQSTSCGSAAIVEPRDNETVLAPRSKQEVSMLRADATYVLIGGTGGLGRSMAKWMVNNGAKNIVLLSRSGFVKGKAKEQIDALNASGANISVKQCNVANNADVESLISSELADLPPIRGVIHGAMVLHDVLFEKMTFEQYQSVIESKVAGAWNFHRSLCGKTLDFFVVISSAAGAVGNRGQAAYAAANTFLNAFTQFRVRQGLPAASIDLTAVSDAGYLAEDLEKAAEVARNLGSDTICESEVLALIGAAISGQLAATCNHHTITGMRITATQRPFWSNDAKFVHLLRVAEEEAAKSATTSTTTTISWSAALKAATTRSGAEQVVCDGLVEKIADVISIEKEELDTARALSHYPLDSLTAIEVRNFITRMFEANLQVLELLAAGSIQTLAKLICGKSKVAIPA